MKRLIIAAIAGASLSLTAASSSACETNTVSYCAPYRVNTCVVKRCSYCKTAYDRCGNAYHYTLTVVTYRDNYSDGSFKTYTHSYRG